MNILFVLIRLPFFLIVVYLWVCLGIVVAALALGLAPIVVLVGGAALIIAILSALISAAFKNDITPFLEFCGELLKSIRKTLLETWTGIVEYFEVFAQLYRWLVVGSSKDSSGAS